MAEADEGQGRSAVTAPPEVTASEMAEAVRRAGLAIDAGQLADLTRGWQQLTVLAARIPRDRPFADDLTGVGVRRPPAEGAA